MLDRPAKLLWETWPTGLDHSPPPTPLRIVRSAATGTWRNAIRGAAQTAWVRRATFVTTTRRPPEMNLIEADLADVNVVRITAAHDTELLDRRVPVVSAIQRRMVATRYWEKSMFAHALTSGIAIPEKE
jgi:hypothetical protein